MGLQMSIDDPVAEMAPWLHEAKRLSALGLTPFEIESVLAKRGYGGVAIMFAVAVLRSDEVRARYAGAYRRDADDRELTPWAWFGPDGPLPPSVCGL